MKLNRSMLVAGVVTTIAAGSLLGVGAASADTANGNSSLIDKIATRFGLNREDVEAVFEEEKAARQAERATEFSEHLQDKVDSGDISAEQKTLIEQKFSELQTARESERDALEAWADENGIDMKYLMGGRGHMHRDGTYLDNAVADGDLTAEQKTLIEQKQEELRTARETARDELEKWADENNIDLQEIMPLGRGKGGHGGGMMGGMR